MNQETLHGWYSTQSYEKNGYTIWLTPEGKQVVLTMTSNSATDSGSGWKDAKYIGPVTKWVKSYWNNPID